MVENFNSSKNFLTPSAEETRLEEIAVRYLMNEGGEALIEAIASYKKYLESRTEIDVTDRLLHEPTYLHAIKVVMREAGIHIDPVAAGGSDETVQKFINIVWSKVGKHNEDKARVT